MVGLFAKILRDPRGATAIEYGLILAFVALTIMASLLGVGSATSSMWGNVNSKVEAARAG